MGTQGEKGETGSEQDEKGARRVKDAHDSIHGSSAVRAHVNLLVLRGRGGDVMNAHPCPFRLPCGLVSVLQGVRWGCQPYTTPSQEAMTTE
jgi:hypothetical protein